MRVLLLHDRQLGGPDPRQLLADDPLDALVQREASQQASDRARASPPARRAAAGFERSNVVKPSRFA